MPVWKYLSYANSGQGETLKAILLESADVITGSAYNDVLLGYDGNDTLIGGVGSDRMDGGIGDDTVSADATNYLDTLNIGLNFADAMGLSGSGDLHINSSIVGSDMKLDILDTADTVTDSLTVKNWMTSAVNRFGTIHYQDRTFTYNRSTSDDSDENRHNRR